MFHRTTHFILQFSKQFKMLLKSHSTEKGAPTRSSGKNFQQRGLQFPKLVITLRLNKLITVLFNNAKCGTPKRLRYGNQLLFLTLRTVFVKLQNLGSNWFKLICLEQLGHIKTFKIKVRIKVRIIMFCRKPDSQPVVQHTFIMVYNYSTLLFVVNLG